MTEPEKTLADLLAEIGRGSAGDTPPAGSKPAVPGVASGGTTYPYPNVTYDQEVERAKNFPPELVKRLEALWAATTWRELTIEEKSEGERLQRALDAIIKGEDPAEVLAPLKGSGAGDTAKTAASIKQDLARAIFRQYSALIKDIELNDKGEVTSFSLYDAKSGMAQPYSWNADSDGKEGPEVGRWEPSTASPYFLTRKEPVSDLQRVILGTTRKDTTIRLGGPTGDTPLPETISRARGASGKAVPIFDLPAARRGGGMRSILGPNGEVINLASQGAENDQDVADAVAKAGFAPGSFDYRPQQTQQAYRDEVSGGRAGYIPYSMDPITGALQFVGSMGAGGLGLGGYEDDMAPALGFQRTKSGGQSVNPYLTRPSSGRDSVVSNLVWQDILAQMGTPTTTQDQIELGTQAYARGLMTEAAWRKYLAQTQGINPQTGPGVTDPDLVGTPMMSDAERAVLYGQIVNQSSGSSPDIPGYVEPEARSAANKYDDLGRITFEADVPGGRATGYSSPPAMRHGGRVRLPEPAIVVGAWTGKPYAVAAEAGMKEDVRATPGGLKFIPTDEPIRRFAAGGDVEVPDEGYFGRGSSTSGPGTPGEPSSRGNLTNDAIRVDRAPVMPNGFPVIEPRHSGVGVPMPTPAEKADAKAAEEKALANKRIAAYKWLTKKYFPYGGFAGGSNRTGIDPSNRDIYSTNFSEEHVQAVMEGRYADLPESRYDRERRRAREAGVPIPRADIAAIYQQTMA